MDDNRIDPGHNTTRDTLRTIGPILLVIGGGFMIVGLVDFFSAFGGFHSPTLFWCLFVGMILLGIGLHLTPLGYIGKITRYMSQEMAPPAKDTFNYMADETKDGIKKVVGAVAEGLRQGSSARVAAGGAVSELQHDELGRCQVLHPLRPSPDRSRACVPTATS